MIKLLLHVTALVAMVLAAPAPVQETDKAVGDEGTPLLRVKRSQEVVMFGNHQNVDDDAKVKKWSLDGDELFDHSAKMQSNTAQAEDLEGNPDIKDTSMDDMMADGGDLTVAELLAEEVAAEKNEGKNQEDEEVKERLEEIAKEEEGGEVEETSEENNNVNMDQSEELSSEEDGQNAIALPGDNGNNPLDYWYYYDYPDESYRKKRSTLKARNQRSINAFTAEGMNMAKADKKTMRVKRDLTADDLEALLALENSNIGRGGYDDPLGYYGEDIGEEDPWGRFEDEEEELYEPYEPLEDVFAEETAYPVSDDELVRAKERMEILDFLEENPELLENLHGLYEEEEEEEPYQEIQEDPYQTGYEGYPDDTGRYEELIEEEDDFEPEIEYRSIVYDGEPGIFIPVKREYVSMVPGMRKRDFYPYEEEPQGHWGAFVGEEEKRNAEAYERLYRLAQALRSEGDYRKK